jgi:hypothetical protein
MPAYFHYLEENDGLNQIINRFAKRVSFTSEDLGIVRHIAEEQDPEEDRPDDLLGLCPQSTCDFPITQTFRRLRARVSGSPLTPVRACRVSPKHDRWSSAELVLPLAAPTRL